MAAYAQPAVPSAASLGQSPPTPGTSHFPAETPQQAILKTTEEIDLGMKFRHVWFHFVALLCFLDLLTKAITEAHSRTCLYTNEQIEKLRCQVAPPDEVERYQEMV